MKEAFNEEKFIAQYTKYNKAKKLSEKYLLDTEYVIQVIDMLKDKGVLVLSNDYKNEPEIWNDYLECYTPSYAMYIWRECVLPALDYSYEEYKTFDSIVESLKKVGGVK